MRIVGGIVGAFGVAIAMQPTSPGVTRSASPGHSHVSMQEFAAAPNFFEEEPPPSWGSADWRWGYADGEAHKVAARVREELSKPHRRTALLSYARMGAVDFFDLKMALALKCQRARNLGYDAPDGRWEALMEEMAACAFEADNMIDQKKLAEAVNLRLEQPIDDPVDIDGNYNPAAVVAAALDELGFVQKGL